MHYGSDDVIGFKILSKNRYYLIVPASADKMTSHLANFQSERRRHGISALPYRT